MLSTTPGAIRRREWVKANKEKYRESYLRYYKTHKEQLCEKRREYRITHREQCNDKCKNWRQTIVTEGFSILGDQCTCCGETNKRFLTIDHINNDGHITRKQNRHSFSWYEAKRSGWDKYKFQILCYNCNLGKARNGGVCPHLA